MTLTHKQITKLLSSGQVTQGEKSIIKWQYRLHGSFMTALWQAISLADDINLGSLANAFPNEVEAYRQFTTVKGLCARLESLAKEVE